MNKLSFIDFIIILFPLFISHLASYLRRRKSNQAAITVAILGYGTFLGYALYREVGFILIVLSAILLFLNEAWGQQQEKRDQKLASK